MRLPIWNLKQLIYRLFIPEINSQNSEVLMVKSFCYGNTTNGLNQSSQIKIKDSAVKHLLYFTLGLLILLAARTSGMI